MPNRVAVSTICMITITTTTQISSDHRWWPNTPTTQPDDGALTGAPLDISSDTPSMRKYMPSVTMNDGMLNRVRISPFTVPIAAHTSSASSSARISGTPLSANDVSTNGASVNTKPADRSISPQISSFTSPAATIAHGAKYWAIV